jgi:hypothetical protein
VRLQGPTPQPAELKDFIKEYAHELQRQAWQLDAGGESQQLLDEWTERYGQDGQLQLYQAVGCDKCNHAGTKAASACTS